MIEKRKNVRVDINSINEKVSRDKQEWKEVRVFENSSKGLSFSSSDSFEEGDVIYFAYEVLDVRGTVLDGKVKTQGTIIRKDEADQKYVYGVKFDKAEHEIGQIVFYIAKQ